LNINKALITFLTVQSTLLQLNRTSY